MKKIYINPEMEVVELNMIQPLMTTSSMPLVDDTTIDDAGDILAPPGLDVGPSIPGVPSYIFE